MKIDLTGKVAVVTGAAKGIGRKIGLAYAEHGATLVALDIDVEAAQNVIDEVTQLGAEGMALKVDVAVSSQVNAAIRKALGQYGHIDILVNNAGIYPESLVADMLEEEWDRVIGVHLKGAFNCSKAVAKTMMDQRSGRIISVSSRAGRQGSKGHAHYAAAKAGILGLTMSLARELGSFGITVNAIAPGIIETDMTKDTIKGGEKKLSDYMIGRYGRTEDLTGVALLLASEFSGYITGATIDVNGGSWMG
jgi:3-oxoacyl-[acyl-carrier protein] reductase